MTNTATSRPNPVRSRKRHAAKKARAAALGLSLATTGALTLGFANADRAEAATSTATATKTFTGSASTMKWGTTQVRITVAGGRITDVTAVQLPDSKAKSVRLSTNAAAVLRTRVLAAQSADVDTVSGATMTADAYLDSLQSAIDKAFAAGALSASTGA